MPKKPGKRSSDRPLQRPKKRKFPGNRFSNEHSNEFASASAAKLKNNDELSVSVDPSFQYCIVQWSVFTFLQTILKCKNCNKDVKFSKSDERGVGFKLCISCECRTEFVYSCPKIDRAYEINRRLVFVMRILGAGLGGITNFCGLMDIGSKWGQQTYYSAVDNINIAVDAVLRLVLNKASNEEKALNKAAGEIENNFAVSGDGSWAKRGYTSLLGIISLIGKRTGKILDVIVKSSYCKLCSAWKSKRDTVEFEEFYEEHRENCTANHEGSAGKMEVDGVIEMFERSEDLHDARYKYYIGDGDTKTFKNLLDVQPYGSDFLIEKKECVLHVKKRMFSRAKEAKKKLTLKKKQKKLAEKDASKNPKQTPQKGPKKVQLTLKLMKNLSTYYGLAIRRNTDSVENMHKEIWAAYYHKISTDANPQHSYCPVGEKSWCNWRKAEAAGGNALKNFKHPPPLDDEVQEILKPIYEDLSSKDLLKRCLGNFTQNNNESYNSCVWNMAPKHSFCGKKIINMAANISACTFNEGFIAILKIMQVLGITIGHIALQHARTSDATRIKQAERQSTEASKEARTARRDQKSLEEEQYEREEGILYGAGIAD